MIGAIAGDIIGSRFEFNNIHTKDFDLFEGSFFTDDTVLTCAVADAVFGDHDYAAAFRKYGRQYPSKGYGSMFHRWLFSDDMGPYGSYGNGSAMRVSPVAYAFDTIGHVLAEAERTALVTHNHPEGIKGAQATAAAIFLARTGRDKKSIRTFVAERFGYDLERSMEWLHENYYYNETCQRTVPEAIICFLESDSFEDAIRNAISIGGDSDTLACITGSIAEAFYGGVPEELRGQALSRLPKELTEVVLHFEARVRLKQLMGRAVQEIHENGVPIPEVAERAFASGYVYGLKKSRVILGGCEGNDDCRCNEQTRSHLYSLISEAKRLFQSTTPYQPSEKDIHACMDCDSKRAERSPSS